MEPRDPTLDVLLDLDGQVLVVDSDGGHWVRFVVTRVEVSSRKPHGIDYSLTLHAADGQRLVGFDNAHLSDGNSGVSRRIIAIGCGRSPLTSIATQRPYSPTFGQLSTQCCVKEE